MLNLHIRASASAAVNYAEWNPADKDSAVTLSNFNRTYTNSTGSRGVRATLGAVGCYWEVKKDSSGDTDFGIATASHSLLAWCGQTVHSIGYDSSDGKLYKNGTAVGAGPTATTGDVIGFALDATNLKVWKNTSLLFTYAHGLTGTIFPCGGDYAASQSSTANFKASDLVNPANGSGYILGVR